jgi:hypothetical protein
MAKFESSIKVIPYSQAQVYRCVSDLQNLEKVKDRVPEEKVSEFKFNHDTISMSVAPVGEIAMQIVEREEPKCVKFETTQSPVPFNFWIQLLPVTDTSCKMKLTIKADVNPFVSGMISKPIKEAIEKIADALAMVKYE